MCVAELCSGLRLHVMLTPAAEQRTTQVCECYGHTLQGTCGGWFGCVLALRVSCYAEPQSTANTGAAVPAAYFSEAISVATCRQAKRVAH
jgi:hypothetical protein